MLDVLAGVDLALMDMRRLWSPTTSGRAARGAAPGIDLSTVLIVQVVGDSEQGLAIAEAADRLGVAAATASRLCDRAVAAGYVRKTADRSNARRRTLTLTAAGTALRSESIAFRRGYLEGILADWAAEDVVAFERLLKRFAASVAAHPPNATPFRVNDGDR